MARPRRWWITLAIFVVCFPALARELTFQQRVDAQAAIERVRYAHQIGATKPFEAAVPRELLEGKVRRDLREAAAPDGRRRHGGVEELIERELERVVRESRLPSRLHELFAALGN